MIDDGPLDAALNAIKAGAAVIYLCSDEPDTYLAASSTLALGYKSWGAGLCFGAPIAGVPDGRALPSVPISNGSVLITGTVSHWAACGASNTLYAAGPLLSPIHVISLDLFVLPSFLVRLPRR